MELRRRIRVVQDDEPELARLRSWAERGGRANEDAIAPGAASDCGCHKLPGRSWRAVGGRRVGHSRRGREGAARWAAVASRDAGDIQAPASVHEKAEDGLG